MYGGGKIKSEENIIKSINNLEKRENKEIKNKIMTDIRTLFELEEKHYYIPIRVANFWNNNYIKYESSGDRNRKISVK